MTRRIPAVLAVAAVLLGAASAWATVLTPEGSPYPGSASPSGVYAADFDGDGRPDFATVNHGGGTGDVRVYLRQASGGFAEEAGSPFAGATATGAIGDFDGDGRPDIALAEYTYSTGVKVLRREAAGGFTLQSTPATGGGWWGVEAGDFNGDGRIDLAAVNRNTSSVTILLRNAANTGFEDGQSYPSGESGASSYAVAVADLDGDGDLDLAVANGLADNVAILLNDGTGAFADGGTIATGAYPSDIAAADLDGDGRSDLAVSDYEGGTVTLLLRDAANTGFDVTAVDVGHSPGQIGIGDLDGDGAPEIAVPIKDTGSLVILHRNGSTFAPEAPVAVGGSPIGVAVADFDGDGTGDAAVVGYTPNQVRVLLGSPTATPTPTPTATATPTPAPAPTATPLPAPPAGQVNVLPARGTVKIKLRGSRRYVDLTEAIQVKVGATVDTRKGRVTIVGPGTGDRADFFDGIFTLSQSRGLTTLTLSEPLDCRRRARSAASKPKTRRLWGDGKGRFRTRGRYAAATIRGTRWLLQDTCTTTRVSVRQGSVSFRDEVRRRTVVVRHGKTATARERR